MSDDDFSSFRGITCKGHTDTDTYTQTHTHTYTHAHTHTHARIRSRFYLKVLQGPSLYQYSNHSSIIFDLDLVFLLFLLSQRAFNGSHQGVFFRFTLIVCLEVFSVCLFFSSVISVDIFFPQFFLVSTLAFFSFSTCIVQWVACSNPD